MAKPTCVRCGGTEFERQYGVVSNKAVYFINCSSCGGVSVIDRTTEDAIEKIERKVR
jgi:translation initiation factor 2 beta subunit (eIF-2beta)/eIF-5